MAEPTEDPKYSYCETVHAGPFSLWHIRPLSSIGRKLGGGADTKSLCGKTVSWDRPMDVSRDVEACRSCLAVYRSLQKDS